MKSWIQKNLRNIIVTSFIIPILLVAFVSISHVTSFYGISNPFSWAIYLSVAIEIAAISALAGLSVRMGSFIYIPFGIVTLIQFIGNIFFAFSYIDETSQLFKDWMEMAGSVLEPVGIEPTDVSSHKRILALFSGGMLPLISLTFAHMLVKFTDTFESKKEIISTDIDIDEISKQAGKIESVNQEPRWIPTEEELEKLERILVEPRVNFDEERYIPSEEDLKKIEEILILESQNVVEEQTTTTTTTKDITNLTEMIDSIQQMDENIGTEKSQIIDAEELDVLNKTKRLSYLSRDAKTQN